MGAESALGGGSLIVILKQAFFAQRRIWASRAKRRVSCDAIIARFARFLTKLHHYPALGDPEVQVERAAEGWVCLPQALNRVYRSAESAAPPKRRPSRNGGTRCGRMGWFTSGAKARLSQRWKRCATQTPAEYERWNGLRKNGLVYVRR